jgi:uroporphyrinogen-III synthase
VKKILITTNRYKEFEKYLKDKYEIIPFPTIATVPLNFKDENINIYDYYLFTSVNAVRFFFDKVNPEILKGKKFIAVGEKTEESLKKIGFGNIIIPEEFRAEGLIKLIEENWEKFENKSVLVPRAKKGREILTEYFKDKKIKIDILPVYETILNIPENKEKIENFLKNNEIYMAVFTSPSTFKNFLKIFDKGMLKNIKIAVIGKTTKKAVEEEGLKVNIIPQKFNFKELSKLILKY